MLKKGPHPIDRAIWGAFDGTGTPPPAGPPSPSMPRPPEDEDAGEIDLGALIAEAQVGMAERRGERAAAAPAKDAQPLSAFPFGPLIPPVRGCRLATQFPRHPIGAPRSTRQNRQT